MSLQEWLLGKQPEKARDETALWQFYHTDSYAHEPARHGIHNPQTVGFLAGAWANLIQYNSARLLAPADSDFGNIYRRRAMDFARALGIEHIVWHMCEKSITAGAQKLEIFKHGGDISGIAPEARIPDYEDFVRMVVRTLPQLPN